MIPANRRVYCFYRATKSRKVRNILILRYCVAVAKPVILQQDFIYHTYEIQINSHGKCLRPRDDGHASRIDRL